MILRTNQAEIDYADGYVALQRLKPGQPAPGSPPDVRRRLRVSWVLLIVLTGMLIWVAIDEDPDGPGRRARWLAPVLACFVPLLGSWLLAAALGRWAQPRIIARHEPDDVEITIGSGGICSDSPRVRSLFRWSFFSRYAESGKSFALEGKRISSAPMIILVLPKAAFSSRQEIDEFRRAAEGNVYPDAMRSSGLDPAFPVRLLHEQEDDSHENEGPTLFDHLMPAEETRTQDGFPIVENAQYEHWDLAAAFTGVRRTSRWFAKGWSVVIWGILLTGIVISSVVAIAAAGREPWMAGLLILPTMGVWSLAKSVAPYRQNMAGPRSQWSQHVLSYGPASVRLQPEGIVLESVHHEMMLKTESVTAVVRTDDAFTVLSKHWEIVIPKRFVPIGSLADVRKALATQFGQITEVPAGKVVCVPRGR